MAKKPSYLGMLNAIANGERGGHELFKAWSGATKDKALRATLKTISLRELEHSVAFEKRISELGFELRAPSDVAASKVLAKQIRLLDSSASDMKKFATFGIGIKTRDLSESKKVKTKNVKGKKAEKKAQRGVAETNAVDPLLQVLADPTIDPQTGALMGRFICEERDTGRMLRAAYKKVVNKAARNAG